MFRPILALSAFAFAAAPAAAANYSATLETPAAGRFITGDITWDCGASTCRGATEESRPVVLCQSLAKRAGHIDTFLVDGRALSESDLASCNASARAKQGKALAAQ